MIRPTAAYFIHRVGTDGPQRDRNIAAALRWIRFLGDALPDLPISAPWLPYVMAFDEAGYRERGIRDGKVLASADTHDIGIICGPEVSRGCAVARDNLLSDPRGRGVLDLTGLGLVNPPPLIPETIDFVRIGVEYLWTAVLEERMLRTSRGFVVKAVAGTTPAWVGARVGS